MFLISVKLQEELLLIKYFRESVIVNSEMTTQLAQ